MKKTSQLNMNDFIRQLNLQFARDKKLVSLEYSDGGYTTLSDRNHAPRDRGLLHSNIDGPQWVNDGQDINMSETIFWDTEMGQSGPFCLTWNEGAARLLVPDCLRGDFNAHMSGTQQVVLSRGPHMNLGGRDYFEILFDDGSDGPMHLFMPVNASHMTPDFAAMPREFPLTVWTRDGKAASFNGKFRVAKELPLLAPWTDGNVLLADPKLASLLDQAYIGRFETHMFPYLHRHAVKLSRGGVAGFDWEAIELAPDLVIVAPMMHGTITAYANNGQGFALSPEGFGILCCINTLTNLFKVHKSLMTCQGMQKFAQLIHLAEVHPERSSIFPHEYPQGPQH